MKGVVYVAYGDKARAAAVESIDALRRHDEYPITVVSDRPLSDANGAAYAIWNEPGYGARWAKLNVDRLVSYGEYVYLDADTLPRQSIAPLFDALAAGWDVALAASGNQEQRWLWHVAEDEREATENAWGLRALQLQAGVMAVARNERTAALYDAWREEWRRWGRNDQAALLRALRKVPVRLWLAGYPFNSERGEIIEHRDRIRPAALHQPAGRNSPGTRRYSSGSPNGRYSRWDR